MENSRKVFTLNKIRKKKKEFRSVQMELTLKTDVIKKLISKEDILLIYIYHRSKKFIRAFLKE